MLDISEESAESSQHRLFMEKGLELLSAHAFDMDYLRVVKVLPGSLEVTFVSEYLRKVVPYVVHKRRMRQITNLYKRQYMRCRTELAEARSQFIKMDYDSRCAKCGKRIGDAVFILKPKTLKKLHYSCFYRKRQPDSPQFQSAVEDREDEQEVTQMRGYERVAQQR